MTQAAGDLILVVVVPALALLWLVLLVAGAVRAARMPRKSTRWERER